MPQPTPYSRSYSFGDFSTLNPSLQQPGVRIDAELDAISATLAGILTNLTLIQRDDGHLVNRGVSLDQLALDVLASIAAAGSGNTTAIVDRIIALLTAAEVSFTATGGQTAFDTGAQLTDRFVSVYFAGIRLVPSRFSIVGTSVVLTDPCQAGDLVSVIIL